VPYWVSDYASHGPLVEPNLTIINRKKVMPYFYFLHFLTAVNGFWRSEFRQMARVVEIPVAFGIIVTGIARHLQNPTPYKPHYLFKR